MFSRNLLQYIGMLNACNLNIYVHYIVLDKYSHSIIAYEALNPVFGVSLFELNLILSLLVEEYVSNGISDPHFVHIRLVPIRPSYTCNNKLY